jgi:MFS family permease
VGYFILGSWYTEKELALVFVAGPAGQAFSGFMQAGIYTSMNGLAGLAGWRWLYIICGIISESAGVVLYHCKEGGRPYEYEVEWRYPGGTRTVPSADADMYSNCSRPLRSDAVLDPS